MSRTTLFAVALMVFAATPLAAQQNEFGVFISWTQLESTDVTDAEFPDEIAEIDFESDIGYGASYNRYWGEMFSTEFAVQQITADAQINVTGPGFLDTSFDAGQIEMMAGTAIAQLHFGTGAIVPYIGAGAAYVRAEAESTTVEGEEEDVDLESETTWVANAGIDFRFGPGLAIGVDAKYIPYEGVEEGFPDSEGLELNPLIFSAGLKLRF